MRPDTGSSAALWQRLARPFPLAETVDALFGLAPDVTARLAGTVLCSSDEAGALLHDLPSMLRALTTSVQGSPTRTRGEIRGSVLWSETMSARAGSFGDPDLFVCAIPQRDYDTAENRVLVQALAALADAGRSIDKGGSANHDDPAVQLARARGRQARLFLDHPALSGVRRERVPPRTVKRVRGSKSAGRYLPAMVVLSRAAEPLDFDDIVPYCDRRTLRQHEVLLRVLEDLEQRGMRVPPLRVEAGVVLGGPVTYVHPQRLGRRDRLHGILVGEILLDVPDHDGYTTRAAAATELAARSHGHPSVLVTDPSEVTGAIDLAVRDARERLNA